MSAADASNPGAITSAAVERPHNREAEQAVLAAMILDQDIVEEAVSRLAAHDFYRGAHRAIFSAISDLSERRTPIDQISLADRLEARGELDQAGGLNYIVTLANNSMAIYNWENHIEIVRRNSLMRDLMDAAEQIKGLAQSPMDDTEEIVGEAERLLLAVTQERVESDFERIGELLMRTNALLEEQGRDQKHLVGVPSGFIDLDRHLAGFRGGDLVILAARPGVGKSTLALNMAVNAAKAGFTVAFFSLEMPSDQLTQRIICAEAGVNGWRMRTATLDQADWDAIIKASDTLYSCELYIEDNPSLNLMQLRAKTRRQLRNVAPGQGIVMIDYLQLMQPPRISFERQRYVEVGELTRGLKVLAKELNIPILVLSQLSRSIEARTDKRPQLSDLRESGSIEQDADVVLFIDRLLQKEEAEDKGRPPEGTAKLYIGKNRNGLTGIIDLAFDNRTTKFTSLSTYTSTTAYDAPPEG
jgi:replicative DNA helicase